ncbi:TadE/TadG family type IV pilus assembly protein [Paeniglutamicibacter sulfureus]|nr:pilus assembly protein [Paeniglutamicibacter sulfureus]
MRRLRKSPDSERGTVSVMTALLLVALLGFTALVVDVGMLYAEKAQLQNGADAAALAVAQECALSLASTNCATASPLAAGYAKSNANDGLSNIQSVQLNKSAGTVTVTTGAQQAGGEANNVSLSFARILGFDSAEVGATAGAQWGSPVAGPTVFPAAFSVCQVEGHVDGGLQRLGLHGGSYANPGCNYGPAGAPVPGGFGWLAQIPGQCGGYIDLLIQEGGSAPGNSEPPNCTSVLNRWAAEITAGGRPTVLLPVFNLAVGTGSGAVYKISSFAAFEVAGWKFTGGSSLPSVFRNTTAYAGSQACTGDCRGIIGKFVRYVSLDEGHILGPVNRYGATVVRMTH